MLLTRTNNQFRNKTMNPECPNIRFFLTKKKTRKNQQIRIVVKHFRNGRCRGVFRTFELRVLTIIDCPKIAGAKGQ